MIESEVDYPRVQSLRVVERAYEQYSQQVIPLQQEGRRNVEKRNVEKMGERSDYPVVLNPLWH